MGEREEEGGGGGKRVVSNAGIWRNTRSFHNGKSSVFLNISKGHMYLKMSPNYAPRWYNLPSSYAFSFPCYYHLINVS